MGGEQAQGVGRDAGDFGRVAEEVFGMHDEVLVKRRGRGDEDGQRCARSPPRPPHLLPRARDAARVADEDGGIQRADVKA